MALQTTSGHCTYGGFDFPFDFIGDASRRRDITLLLGGVLQDRASWKNYVREFSQYNDVLIVDLPGVGHSGVLPAHYSFDFLAECVNHLLVTLHIDQVNIFSTSYSTIIAFEFSIRFPQKVNRLVISSSMTHIPEPQMKVMLASLYALEANDLDAFSQLFVDGISNTRQRARNAALVERVLQSGIRALTPLQIHQFCENTKRVLGYQSEHDPADKIPLTPLIFTGELDTFTPPLLCREVGNFFTHFHFRTIPDLDHFFHIGNNALIFSNLVPYFTRGRIPSFDGRSPSPLAVPALAG